MLYAARHVIPDIPIVPYVASRCEAAAGGRAQLAGRRGDGAAGHRRRSSRRGRSASIDVAARPSVAPLFTLVDGVREVVVLEHRSAVTRDFAADLAGRPYDAALLLPNSFQSALDRWRAGILAALGIQDRSPGAAADDGGARPGRGIRRPTINT